MRFAIALGVFVATSIQARLQALELGRTNRVVIDHMSVEDRRVAEAGLRRRWSTWRGLKAARDPQMHREIRRVKLSLLSWAILMVASGAAAVLELVD